MFDSPMRVGLFHKGNFVVKAQMNGAWGGFLGMILGDKGIHHFHPFHQNTPDPSLLEHLLLPFSFQRSGKNQNNLELASKQFTICLYSYEVICQRRGLNN